MLRSALIVSCLVLMPPPAPVAAHPHGWIDMQSKVVFDAQGRVRALEQAWLFDELYSAFILDEFALNGESVEDGLTRLARDDIAALAAFDYFTVLEVAGEAQPFAAVTAYANGVADERIWLKFELPLAEPVAPGAGELTYVVFDPTYYIEVLHVGEEPVQLTGPGSDACTASIVEPAPPTEIANLAASLDMYAFGGDDLGRHFAQTIQLACER